MEARRYSENSASKARVEGVGDYRRLMFTLLSKKRRQLTQLFSKIKLLERVNEIGERPVLVFVPTLEDFPQAIRTFLQT